MKVSILFIYVYSKLFSLFLFQLKTIVKETLKVFAENISLNYISLKVAKSAEEAKNPKLHTESLTWMSDALKEFGYRYAKFSLNSNKLLFLFINALKSLSISQCNKILFKSLDNRW